MNAARTLVLTIDGGATRSRAVLYEQDQAVAQQDAGPANLFVDSAAAAMSINELWAGIARQARIDSPTHVHAACGLAGAEQPADRQRLARQLPGFASLAIVTDGYAALIGAGLGKPGALMVVGTGTAVHRLLPDGSSRVAGGYGMLAGDRGSGAWIGLRAVRAWLQWEDGCTSKHSASSLREPLRQRLGESRLQRLQWLADAAPRDYAEIAAEVVAAAADSDAFATGLLDRAAGQVAASVRCLVPEGDDCPVYLAGGLALALRPRLLRDFGLPTLEPQQDANFGCWLLATNQAPPERAQAV